MIQINQHRSTFDSNIYLQYLFEKKGQTASVQHRLKVSGGGSSVLTSKWHEQHLQAKDLILEAKLVQKGKPWIWTDLYNY